LTNRQNRTEPGNVRPKGLVPGKHEYVRCERANNF
jgi:hypothetical protein